MQPYGGDRLRAAGGKIILHAPISKGWTPRRAKTSTHAEFPGTAVLWDEQYFEVIAADLLPRGGVRYVLEPWRDEHVIRVFDTYSEETEAKRIEDFRAAVVQRKKSIAAQFAGIFLGHFPEHVQQHLENELGVIPATMTKLSCIPSVVLLGICAWLAADAKLQQVPSPVPLWLWLIVFALMVESANRFQVAMLQNRGMASLLGTLVYVALWYLTPIRRTWPSPFATGRGQAIFTLPPPDDEIVLRDKLEVRGAWLTLLTAEEQRALAERYGFDYRKHAPGLAWILLAGSSFGLVSSLVKVADSGSTGAIVSIFLAGAIAVEQVRRLLHFKHGPAGSFLGVLVRPFMRDLLGGR